jgi:Na+-transporting methylmalonyl-CoA/oxaloacetate decarboxylase gamma subunit
VFSTELKGLIVQVLTSWQVLVVTIGIILYIFIVSYVSQIYRSARPKEPKVNKPKKEKKSEKVAEDTGNLGLGD